MLIMDSYCCVPGMPTPGATYEVWTGRDDASTTTASGGRIAFRRGSPVSTEPTAAPLTAAQRDLLRACEVDPPARITHLDPA
jgi:hypothetical protein